MRAGFGVDTMPTFGETTFENLANIHQTNLSAGHLLDISLNYDFDAGGDDVELRVFPQDGDDATNDHKTGDSDNHEGSDEASSGASSDGDDGVELDAHADPYLVNDDATENHLLSSLNLSRPRFGNKSSLRR